MRFNILFVQKFPQNFVENYFFILYMCSVRLICMFKNLVLYFMTSIRNRSKNIPEGRRKEARYRQYQMPLVYPSPYALRIKKPNRDEFDKISMDSLVAAVVKITAQEETNRQGATTE